MTRYSQSVRQIAQVMTLAAAERWGNRWRRHTVVMENVAALSKVLAEPGKGHAETRNALRLTHQLFRSDSTKIFALATND